MADNGQRYVSITVNNSALIANSSVARWPALVSTDGYQSLSKVINQYTTSSALYTHYLAEDMPIGNVLKTMWTQTYSPFEIWGYDLETVFTMIFTEGFTDIPFEIQWLDIDNNAYSTFSHTAADLAGIVTFINSNISTVTAELSGLAITVTPNEESLNQLVRINFTGLLFTEVSFAAAGAAANYTAALLAIINCVPTSRSFYANILEPTLFLPLLADNNTTKIDAQVAFASAVESTVSMGDDGKVGLIGTSAIQNFDNTACLNYRLKALNIQRTLFGYQDVGAMIAAAASFNFGQSNGNQSWALKTLLGIVPPFLTSAQLNSLYLLLPDGSLDADCLRGNYYTSVEGVQFFYPGITPSGLPFDVTILTDNIAMACRAAQINCLVKNANAGTQVGMDQKGINTQVGVIQSTVNLYSQYLQPVNDAGDLVIINAPTIEQVKANPTLFTNRVLSGITIGIVPAGSMNKIAELLYTTI